MTDELVLEVPRDWQALNMAWKDLESFLQERALPSKVNFMALLVLEEIGTNILKYGYGDEMQAAVGEQGHKPLPGFTMRLQLGDDIARIVFEDQGVAFDPTCVSESPQSSLEEATIGGRGLLLLQKMSKEMRYRREDERNILEVDLSMAP